MKRLRGRRTIAYHRDAPSQMPGSLQGAADRSTLPLATAGFQRVVPNRVSFH